MTHLSVFLLPNSPAVLVPDQSIVEIPLKARLYAACGWAAHAAVYDPVSDKWLGMWLCPEDTNIRMLMAQGKIHQATKPYHQW